MNHIGNFKSETFRWPDLIDQLETAQIECWKSEYRECQKSTTFVLQTVRGLSKKFYKKEEVSNIGLKPFIDCTCDSLNKEKIVVHELSRILYAGCKYV